MAESGWGNSLSLSHSDSFLDDSSNYIALEALNDSEELLPCIACNTCVNLTVRRVPAGCSANPLTTYEASRTFQTATVPQRVLVIGGGVAGMHAARFLALQGQDVTLCEATGRLGGQLNACRKMLPDYGMLVDWLSLQLEHLGVRTELRQGCHGGRRS